MRLRNWKETVPYTIEDTLLDVQPHSLDEPFHWCPQVRHLTQAANISKLINPQRGTPVWVKVPESEDEDCKHRWRKGVIEDELFERQYTHMVRRPHTSVSECETLNIEITLHLGHIPYLRCSYDSQAQTRPAHDHARNSTHVEARLS